MSKWARVNLEQKSPILEVINYDPQGVINEQFLDEFLPCPDEVNRGYEYNPETGEFTLPEGYAKHPHFEAMGYVFQGDCELDENGFIILPPPPPAPPEPKYISLDEFRSQLTLTEKILWDNPESGTVVQGATIKTIKQEFPLLVEAESTVEILDLLEEKSIIGEGRASEIYNHFN